ncbi:hypothetical protein ASL83_003270 [Vibrio parahaemolyticus]|nr:hypothetical protein [Vibrio parahaemolyticus]
MAYSTKNPINAECEITKGTFVVGGYNDMSVRLVTGGKEIGFATVAYSGVLSNAMKQYAAKRLTLALRFVNGLSNEGITAELAKRVTRAEMWSKESKFRLGRSSKPELMHDVARMQRCLEEFQTELAKDEPDKTQLQALLIMMKRPAEKVLADIEDR